MSLFAKIHGLLLDWYSCQGRTLPWRAKMGQTPNPYHVYLSEVMLQQTTVTTVIPYFNRFIERWPTLFDLAKAPLHDILVAWQGLGYYRRAHHLYQAAQQLAALPEWPGTVSALRQLAGVGEYTAAAVAAIAFQQPVVPVDGNIVRVMARLFGLASPPPLLKHQVQQQAQQFAMLPQPGHFAQALMDLGARVCRPHAPLCNHCPLQSLCQAYTQGTQTLWPTRAPKIPKPHRYGAAFIIMNPRGEILLRRRPNTGLLAGLMEVPGTEWSETPPSLPDFAQSWTVLSPSVRHTFSHFHLHLTLYQGGLSPFPSNQGEFWVKPLDLCDYPMPAVMKKVLAASEPLWYSLNNGENI